MRIVSRLCIVAIAVATAFGGDALPGDKAPAGTDVADANNAAVDLEDAAPAEADLEGAALAEGAEQDAGPAVEEDPAPRGGASMQWVITHKMRAQLVELGYDDAEIDALNGERAAAIIRNSIRKPMRGVPAGWNAPAGRTGGSPIRTAVRSLGAVGKPIGRALSTKVGGAVAIGGTLAAFAALGSRGAVPSVGRGLLKRASAAPKVFEPEDEPPATSDWTPPPASTEEYWLDRQIDNLIKLVKALLGK